MSMPFLWSLNVNICMTFVLYVASKIIDLKTVRGEMLTLNNRGKLKKITKKKPFDKLRQDKIN